MKVLVIGSGGREHAIVRKLSQSDKVTKIFCAPGNAGIAKLAENVNIKADDISGLKDFALANKIDLTVVGPEDPLVHGIVDEFRKNSLLIFGPDASSARLEGSKSFSKEFMLRNDIPTARYEKHTDYNKAVEALKDFTYPLVIKADGLCAGKGVVICQTPVEALYTLKDILLEKKFGDEGSSLVIEEYLEGFEASVFCLCSNGKLIPFTTAKDYKKIYEADQGPNTGGVGCFSPNLLLDKENLDLIQNKIVKDIEKGLEKEGLLFSGILFIGFMVTKEGPKILEFNVRFGDPETEVMLPRLESDLFDILYKASLGQLEETDIKFSDKVCMTVILTSKGYPASYEKGFEITGIEEVEASEKNIHVIHNGTKIMDDKLVTAGGRVLAVTTLSDNLESARDKIYEEIEKIKFTGAYYRKDIGNISLQ